MAIIPTSGEFAKVPEGSGSGVVVVTITQSAGIPPVYTVDKTAAQVYAAVQSGKSVYGYFDNGSGAIECFSLATISYDGEKTPIGYDLSKVVENIVNTVIVYEEGGVTTVSMTRVPIPNNP